MELSINSSRAKRAGYSTGDVIRRYVRRRWKAPLVAVGAAGTAIMLMGAMPSPWKGKRPVLAVGGPSVGVVESLRSKGVGSPWAGTVQTVAVRPGTVVKQGDLLFRLETDSLRADLTTARLARGSFEQQIRALAAERDVAAREIRREIATLEMQIHQALQSALAVVETPEVDETMPAESVAVEALHLQLAEAQARLQVIRQQWHQEFAPIQQAVREYDSHIRSLQTQINTAERRSPIAGVVTALYAESGRAVGKAEPVVRVDNPAGYRVVMRVSKPVKDRLPIGAGVTTTKVTTEMRVTTSAAKLERVVAGWDKDLFRYYLWLKPANPAALVPGEQVTVHLPEARIPSGPALAVASVRSATP